MNIFEQIANFVKSKFSAYHVQIEEVPDSPNTRSIAVYGVEKNDIVEVRNCINDLDWEICQPKGLVALARIVDFETTKEYYPACLPLPKNSDYDLIQQLVAVNAPYRPWEPVCNIPARSSNEELAFAA